jgi:hypothetical protein
MAFDIHEIFGSAGCLKAFLWRKPQLRINLSSQHVVKSVLRTKQLLSVTTSLEGPCIGTLLFLSMHIFYIFTLIMCFLLN